MDATSPSHRRLVVALDGPGSSGKSSVGAAAALELGYRFCDTGLLYRAATWLALERGVAADDRPGLVALVGEIEFAPDEQGRLRHVRVDGIDRTDEVHTELVDAAVSAVSRVPELRAALLERQRALAAAGGIIMAGRDIGTVVLPDADLKVYLEASVEERARRRVEERAVAPDGPEAAEILAQLRRRDELDSTRPVAPLRVAPDATVIDTEGNRFEQTVAAVVAAIRAAEAVSEDAVPGDAVPADEVPARGTPRRRSVDDEPLESSVNWVIRVSALLARLLARAVTRVRIEGAIDEIPGTGPVIFAANHASNLDAVVVGAWLTPRLGRRLHWLAKKEMFAWPVIGWAAPRGGMHPVDRSTADIDAFRLAKRILDDGQPLFVFPEGTRSPDGTLQLAKDGVATLALRTGATIVPIGIGGSDRVWPRRQKLPHPGGRVTVRIGRPFRLDELVPTRGRGRDAKGLATTALMRRIAALLPARQRGVYADDDVHLIAPPPAPTA